jgi:hypothetical protein
VIDSNGPLGRETRAAELVVVLQASGFAVCDLRRAGDLAAGPPAVGCRALIDSNSLGPGDPGGRAFVVLQALGPVQGASASIDIATRR